MTLQQAAKIEELLREIRSREIHLRNLNMIFDSDAVPKPDKDLYRIRIENTGTWLGDYGVTEHEIKELAQRIINRVSDELDTFKRELKKM